MRNRRQALYAASACVALIASGCSARPGAVSSSPGVGSEPSASTPQASGATPTARDAGLPVGNSPVALVPADFSTVITHPYWPMDPGTRWTYRETAADGSVAYGVTIVTTRTKKIANGITARVVRDTLTERGRIVEDTRDWYAQDRQGNVWYFGEDTAKFNGGRIKSREGSFEAGVGGALGGISLPADPQPGMRYRQEYYRGHAEDNGEVLSVSEIVQVPLRRFRGALLTRDTSTIEPNVSEFKLCAKGVGPVLTIGISGDRDIEELIRVDRAPATAGTGPLGRPNP